MSILTLVISFLMYVGIESQSKDPSPKVQPLNRWVDQVNLPDRADVIPCPDNNALKPNPFNAHNSKLGQFPYVGYLTTEQENEFHLPQEVYASCAATIIHRQWVLTSAECVYVPRAWWLVVGVVDQAEWRKTTYSIYRQYVHPDYTVFENNLYHYNFALLETLENIVFDMNVKPIRINWKGEWSTERGPDSKVVYVGWGLYAGLRNTTASWTKQKYVVNDIMTIEECDKIATKDVDNGFVQVSSNHHICVGSGNDFALCPTDPGGPLLQDNKLIGVVSHILCGSGGATVIADIRRGLPFIRRTLRVTGLVELYQGYGKDVPPGFVYMNPTPEEESTILD